MKRITKRLLTASTIFLIGGAAAAFVTGIPWEKHTITGSDPHGPLSVEMWLFRKFHLTNGFGRSHFLIRKVTLTRPSRVWWTYHPASFAIHDTPHLGLNSHGKIYYRSHNHITPETAEAIMDLPTEQKLTTELHQFSPAFDTRKNIHWHTKPTKSVPPNHPEN